MAAFARESKTSERFFVNESPEAMSERLFDALVVPVRSFHSLTSHSLLSFVRYAHSREQIFEGVVGE